MSVRTIQKGPSLEDIIKNLDKANKNKEHVAIGLFSKGAGKDFDKNLAMRMAHLEKGSVKAHLPPRPVFRTTLESRKTEVKNLIAEIWSDILSGKISKKEGYNKLGKAYTKMLKDQFTRRRFFSLSPNYKVRPSGKLVTSGAIPLIDTGEMRRKITHKVRL